MEKKYNSRISKAFQKNLLELAGFIVIFGIKEVWKELLFIEQF